MREIYDPNQELLKDKDVREDPDLNTHEKELRIVGPKDKERMTISSEIAPAIRYIISHSESEVKWIRIVDSHIVAVCATMPRSLLLLKSEERQSSFWSQVFSKQEETDD